MTKFDTKDGIVKYADQEHQDEPVEVVTGSFKGKKGLVKKAADGMLTIDTGHDTILVHESSCISKKD